MTPLEILKLIFGNTGAWITCGNDAAQRRAAFASKATSQLGHTLSLSLVVFTLGERTLALCAPASLRGKMLSTSMPFPGWPSGGERPVLYLNLTWDEVRDRYRICNWVDDVDNNLNIPLKVAYFIDDVIGPTVLVHYFHPTQFDGNWKIEVIVDKDVNVELATGRLVEILSLQKSDIAGILKSSDFMFPATKPSATPTRG